MNSRKPSEKAEREQEGILELNRETVQELAESQAEAARGGGVCYSQGASCCKGEDSRVTK